MNLSADQLIFLIRNAYPDAVHGRNFWCAHPVRDNSSERIGTAEILQWDLDDTPPTEADIEAFEVTYAADLQAHVDELRRVSLRAEIDDERDRRIAAGFTFEGVFYQSRAEDRENIAGAATAALSAIMNGVVAGDRRWHGGEADFVWIAADNSMVAMDAHTVFALGQAAMAHKQAHIFAARSLKDALPVPEDFTDNSHWPE